MSDESIKQISIDQRASDPRLEIQQEAQEPAVENPEVSGEQEEPVENQETQPEPAPKPKKTAEEVLKGRVGHLTKTLSAKDQALAAAEARLAAAEALLASSGKTAPSGEETPLETTTAPSGGKTYSQSDFEAAVAAKTEADAFNQRADTMYNEGAEKFNDWKDAVDTLVVSGFMDKDLLDAAMAVDNGAIVLHHLGTNLEEAERIAALPPIRKAAEMAKLSTILTAPRSVPVSGAPAPISPVRGSPSPTVDLQRVADESDMNSYIAARAKQGSRWAQPRGQRG